MKTSILLILFSALFIISCNQKDSHKDSFAFADMEMEEGMMPPITRQQESVPPLPLPPVENKAVIKKKIIKDGRIGLKVTNLVLTKISVDSLVKVYDGYYSNESLNNIDSESSYNLTIRIPCSNLESFIRKIEFGNGEVLYKEIDARDVTDQFIDLKSRLKNKRAYLKRYSELLNQARNVKEILEIEEKIRRLEEEVESATGRLKYLGDLVDYSTLRLTIFKQKNFKYNPAKRGKFSERIKQSLSKGWYGFIDFLLLLIKIWPFVIVAMVIVYFFKKLKRRRKQNK